MADESQIPKLTKNILTQCPFSGSEWTDYDVGPDKPDRTKYTCGTVRTHLDNDIEYTRTGLCVERERDDLLIKLENLERDLTLDNKRLIEELAQAQADEATLTTEVAELQTEKGELQTELKTAQDEIARLKEGGEAAHRATHFVLTFGTPRRKGT